MFSIREAAERLKVTSAIIESWIESKRLLAWDDPRQGVLIPEEQILDSREPAKGIAEVLAVISDPRAAWDFLDEESAFVDPDTLVRPIAALRQDKVSDVVAAAHAYLEAFS